MTTTGPQPPTSPAGGRPRTMAGIEWGHRFVFDGSAGPDESRRAALALAARFKPGYVEIVWREGPDSPWVRDHDQPHHVSVLIAELERARDVHRELADWRGTRLVEVGEHPNPPKENDRD